MLKQKIRGLTEKQQAMTLENTNLKNEVVRLKQQLQFQQLKSSSVDAASEVRIQKLHNAMHSYK